VVKQAKRGRGIILTTHSMEEASVLCDRLGIFVDGQLVCVGNPKELTARHGGYYVFTLTVPAEPGQEEAAEALVRRIAPGARLTYALAGTRKYELPVEQVSLSGVFEAMEGAAAEGVRVLDWGVANATLEEVFIKFAKSIGAEGGG
jgi:ABC-type multidrug transport system ATPase subunit